MPQVWGATSSGESEKWSYESPPTAGTSPWVPATAKNPPRATRTQTADHQSPGPRRRIASRIVAAAPTSSALRATSAPAAYRSARAGSMSTSASAASPGSTSKARWTVE